LTARLGHVSMLSMSEETPTIAQDAVTRVRAVVLAHLGDEQVSVYLFGSRARGDAHRRSDIDVGYIAHGPMDAQVLSALREALDELSIPYTVELVDLAATTNTFREMALREAVVWKD